MNKEQVLKAIDRIFGDTSVSPEETREVLKDILDHIESKLAALDDA